MGLWVRRQVTLRFKGGGNSFVDTDDTPGAGSDQEGSGKMEERIEMAAGSVKSAGRVMHGK